MNVSTPVPSFFKKTGVFGLFFGLEMFKSSNEGILVEKS